MPRARPSAAARRAQLAAAAAQLPLLLLLLLLLPPGAALLSVSHCGPCPASLQHVCGDTDLVARLGYDCATVYNFLVPNGYDCATDLVVDLGEPPATCAPLPTCSLADFCTTTCGIEHCAPAALSGDGVALDEGAAGVVLHVRLSNSSAARAFFDSAGEGAARTPA